MEYLKFIVLHESDEKIHQLVYSNERRSMMHLALAQGDRKTMAGALPVIARPPSCRRSPPPPRSACWACPCAAGSR